MLSPPTISAARSSLGRRLLAKRLASSHSSGRTADPKIHARNDGDEPGLFPSDPEGLDDVANPKTPADENVQEIRPPGFVKDPQVTSPKNPRDTSHKLESTPVGLPSELNFQQKRN